jgi:hypothetical protein
MMHMTNTETVHTSNTRIGRTATVRTPAGVLVTGVVAELLGVEHVAVETGRGVVEGKWVSE